MTDPLMTCKGCGADLPRAELIAKAAKESTITWRLCPPPGEMLQAETVGATLMHFAKLLTMIDKKGGVPSVALLKSVKQTDDGAIEFEIQVLRWEHAKARVARIKKLKAASEAA